MDPYDGVVLGPRADARWDPIRRSLGQTRRYAERMDLAAMTPHGDVASSGYCLANPGAEYLVYLPDGKETSLNLSSAPGRLAPPFRPEHAAVYWKRVP